MISIHSTAYSEKSWQQKGFVVLLALLVGAATLCACGSTIFMNASYRAQHNSWWRTLDISNWLQLAAFFGGIAVWQLVSVWEARKTQNPIGYFLKPNAFHTAWLLLTGFIQFQDTLFPGDIGDVLLIGSLTLTALGYWKTFHTARSKTSAKLGLSPIQGAVLIGVLSFLLSLGYTLELLGPRPIPSGDEPSYLMITRSLSLDADIKMDNNYRFKEYRLFGVPYYQSFTHLGKDRINYPHHSIGLPLYLTPWLFFAPKSDPWLLVSVMRIAVAFLSAFLFAQVYLLARELIADASTVLLAIIVGFSTAPLLFYATEIYPELFASLCVIYSLRKLVAYVQSSSSVSQIALSSVSISYLPWLGIKYIAIMGALICVWCVCLLKFRRSWNKWSAFTLPLVASGILYAYFLYALYGNFSPASIYRGVQFDTKETVPLIDSIKASIELLPFRVKSLVNLWTGIWLEQRMGLVFIAPVYCLVFLGFFSFWKRNRRDASLLVIPVLAHLFIYGYDNNWGGYCPPNRPVISVLPIMLIFLAEAFVVMKSSLAGRLVKAIVIGISWVIAYLFLLYPPWLYHTLNPHLPGGESNLLKALHPQLHRFMPLLMGDIKNHAPNIVWGGLFLAMIGFSLFLVFRSDQQPHKSPNYCFSQKLHMRCSSLVLILLFVALCWRFCFPPLNRKVFTPEQDTIPYSMNLLDNNHYGYELGGGWLRGESGTSFRIITMAHHPEIAFEAHSLVDNKVWISCGGTTTTMGMNAREAISFSLKPRNCIHRWGQQYIRMYVRTKDACIPSLLMQSEDDRRLGVFLKARIHEGSN